MGIFWEETVKDFMEAAQWASYCMLLRRLIVKGTSIYLAAYDLPSWLKSSTTMTSASSSGGVLLMTLWMVRSRTESRSLWKQMITDVVGSLAGYVSCLTLHLRGEDKRITKTICINGEFLCYEPVFIRSILKWKGWVMVNHCMHISANRPHFNFPSILQLYCKSNLLYVQW